MFGISTRRCDFVSVVGVLAAFAASFLPGAAWAVGSTPVTVVNPADIAKAEGIQHPYQAQEGCFFPAAFPQECGAIIHNPASQRLVIEFVSGLCGIPSGNNNNVTEAVIKTIIGGDLVPHFLPAQPPVLRSDGIQQIITVSQQVRLYADPGEDILLQAFTVNPSDIGGSGCRFSLSGQAVTVP
jgi:hypothetical protein